MQRQENTIHGEIARRAYGPCEVDDFGRESDQNHCFRPVGCSKGPVLALSIEQDDFFVTIRMETVGTAGTSLLVSVSPRSIVVFTAPTEQEIENDRDLAANDILRFISIPVEIDPEQAEASLEGSQLVLVLPVSIATPRSG